MFSFLTQPAAWLANGLIQIVTQDISFSCESKQQSGEDGWGLNQANDEWWVRLKEYQHKNSLCWPTGRVSESPTGNSLSLDNHTVYNLFSSHCFTSCPCKTIQTNHHMTPFFPETQPIIVRHCFTSCPCKTIPANHHMTAFFQETQPIIVWHCFTSCLCERDAIKHCVTFLLPVPVKQSQPIIAWQPSFQIPQIIVWHCSTFCLCERDPTNHCVTLLHFLPM